MSESDLIALARRGDEAAWESLVREHQQAAFRLAYLLLGDADEAEDAAQEAFIRAYRALDRFDASRPFRPWLLHIAANLARNRRRAAGRYFAALQRALRSEPDSLPGPQGAPARDPKTNESQVLWQAVRRLNETDQEIIYLRYFLEMPEAEAAATLGVAAGTAKSRLSRALNRLRAVVARDFPTLREMLEG